MRRTISLILILMFPFRQYIKYFFFHKLFSLTLIIYHLLERNTGTIIMVSYNNNINNNRTNIRNNSNDGSNNTTKDLNIILTKIFKKIGQIDTSKQVYYSLFFSKK